MVKKVDGSFKPQICKPLPRERLHTFEEICAKPPHLSKQKSLLINGDLNQVKIQKSSDSEFSLSSNNMTVQQKQKDGKLYKNIKPLSKDDDDISNHLNNNIKYHSGINDPDRILSHFDNAQFDLYDYLYLNRAETCLFLIFQNFLMLLKDDQFKIGAHMFVNLCKNLWTFSVKNWFRFWTRRGSNPEVLLKIIGRS